MADELLVAVGCGTGHVHVVGCSQKGADAKLALKASTLLAKRPMFAAPLDSTHMITVSQQLSDDDTTQGALLSVAFDEESGATRELCRVPTGGKGPCHVSVSPNHRWCFVTNYETGHISCCGLDKATFKLTAPLCTVRQGPDDYTGKGRQDGSHPHQAVASRDSAHVYICDLGTDSVNRFKVSEEGQLVFVDALQVRPGAGPRHLAFHPTLPVAYVLHELDNGVTVAAVTPDGRLTIAQVVDACVPGDYDAPPPFEFYTANNHAAEVVVSADGNIVICTNRGHDSLAIFHVNQGTGQLSLTSHVFTKGALPWHAAFVTQDLLAVTTQFDKGLKGGGFLELYRLQQDGGDQTTLRFVDALPIEEPLCAVPL
ncbi:hypothetical protein PTSG_03739 [Salpingoeca rosetta]|uniref:6-phosphogluconolactonase n=1 Tax=Salpingoeca rosetta (strain ATCC 50818 / BSB-021) TaxID=946362 RepID=F2U6F8_SALR5|nr:uncharacterized protein PTSG_03739 [Salpingoeca rosetta]EGD83099.1 hypothetical protein PTSG_03739 [Salpingoeca rosetta]|eukprot:XP_004995463.1 hypothetical protein PTSG_03739 [Salpingoeca rosetta]